MKIIMNEEEYAKKVYTGVEEVARLYPKISYVTRYQYHVLGYSDTDNYNYTCRWLQEHSIFDENNMCKMINDAIKRAKKQPFYNVPDITITESEMLNIFNLKDLKKEKLMFTLLCMAKVHAKSWGYVNGMTILNIPDLFSLARVSLRTDREFQIHDLIKEGYLSLPQKIDSNCVFVNIIDEDSKPVMKLTEEDLQEPAFAYLRYENEEKYERCACCGKLFKKVGRQKYCADCKHKKAAEKIIECVDCGKKFNISVKDHSTCRCAECQAEHKRVLARERKRKQREK